MVEASAFGIHKGSSCDTVAVKMLKGVGVSGWRGRWEWQGQGLWVAWRGCASGGETDGQSRILHGEFFMEALGSFLGNSSQFHLKPQPQRGEQDELGTLRSHGHEL